MDYEKENLIYQNNKILKIVIPRKLFDKEEENIKLIFIGNVNNEIKKILYKIENQDKLNETEEKILNKKYTFLQKKIW